MWNRETEGYGRSVPRASDWWTRHRKWLLGVISPLSSTWTTTKSGLLLPKNCKATRPMTITITRSTLRLFTPRKRKAISQWPMTEKTCPARTRHPPMAPLGLRRLSASRRWNSLCLKWNLPDLQSLTNAQPMVYISFCFSLKCLSRISR